MKKKFIFILSTLCILTLFLIGPNTVKAYDANKDTVSVAGATYKATSNTVTQNLGYGITHIRDLGISSASRLNDYASCGPKDTLVGQQVNVVTVPSNESVRIVNWTYMNASGWSLQTVRNLAENFELHNPGWKVIACVNGDFFDIRGNGALPYQGNGYAVSNGEVYRPYGASTNVGFKNDGGSYPLVGGKKIDVSDLMLQILDENGEVVKEFKVDKKNENPTGNEIAVWFSYYVMEEIEVAEGTTTKTRNTVEITVPATNSYLSLTPERCLAMSKTQVYGKGYVNPTTEDKTLRVGQFAIQTADIEVQKYLISGSMIRVQQNIVGDYAECDNITGAGEQLLSDGKVLLTEGLEDRHPRTVVGIKKDGSIVLMTVDGRQFESDMYGMSYAELSATLLYYDCVEGYNLDGGGSTTVITRNKYGEFDVYNSPSDGNERGDSNALLVVVPDLTLKTAELSDTSVNFSYIKGSNTSISNATVSVNGVTKNLVGDSISFDNLEPETSYVAKYTYDVNYKNSSLKSQTGELHFKTGKIAPTIKRYFYEETDTEYIIHFKVSDPKNTIVILNIIYDRDASKVNNIKDGLMRIRKNQIKDISTLQFDCIYNIKSSLDENSRVKLPIEKMRDYKITYILDGGTNNNDNITNYNGLTEPFNLLAPTKEGYIFDGWRDENGNIISTLEFEELGDISLTALWTEIKDESIKGEPSCKCGTAVKTIIALSFVLASSIIIIRKKH